MLLPSTSQSGLPILTNPRQDLKNKGLSAEVLRMGGALIQGPYSTHVLQEFKRISAYLKANSTDWETFPVSPIRGRFTDKPGSARVGINYGPEINSSFKDPKDALLFEQAYLSFLEIAQEIIGSLFEAYEIPFLPKTGAECAILTASYYLKTPDTSLGLKEHEDFGFATVGVADQPGLEYLSPTQKWIAVEPNQVLFHVGEWARRIFLAHKVHSSPFLHRVVGQKEGRTFLGMFHNPAFSEKLTSDFFGDVKELSFLDFVKESPSYK